MKTFITCLSLAFLFGLPLSGKGGDIIPVSKLKVEDSARIFKLLTEARAYASQRDYEKAVEAALKAAEIAEKEDYEYAKYRSYKVLEQLYKDAGKLMVSAKYKLKAMKSQSRLEAINYERDERERIEKNEKERLIREQQKQLEKEQEELQRKIDEIAILERDKKVSKTELDKRKNEIARKQVDIENKKQTIDIQRETINSTFNQLSLTLDELETQRLQARIFEDSVRIIRNNEELARVGTEKQNLINYLYIVGISGMLILAASFYRMYTVKKGVQDTLINKNNQIETERKKSDDLLLSILPQEVADELKRTGKYESRYYENTTVMVTNFSNFTKISELVTPKRMVEELDFIFRAFDEIMERHNIEKIKTIGDSYLCVSGVPIPSAHDPMNMVRAAKEIQEFISGLILEKKSQSQPFFDIRIGINTGPLVAGIVGAQKFAFDVWGDTVNMASGLEQNCQPGRINISAGTYREVKDRVECEYRGKIEVKNKGGIDMYYLNRIFEN